MDVQPTLDELYRRWIFDVWYGDFDAAEEVFSADFVGHWPGRDVYGPSGVVEQVAWSRDHFVDIVNTVDVGPVVSGDFVCAHWSFRARTRVDIADPIQPVDSPVLLQGSDIMRAEDGVFVEYWTLSGQLDFGTTVAT